LLDPKLQVLLKELENEGVPPNYTLSVAEARRLSRVSVSRFAKTQPKVAVAKNILIKTGDVRIPVRVYVPRMQRDLPVLVYFHGGGWVVGDLDTSDWLCRSMFLAADYTVFSVDYRLAPENKFPTPLEDCYQATRWIAENGYESYADASRLAVGGDSAGGNLAAAVCLLARHKGSPAISYQLLVCPVTNHSFDTDSYEKYAEGYLLTRKDMEWSTASPISRS